MRQVVLLSVIIVTLAADPALARRAPRPAALASDTSHQAQWSSDRRAGPDPVIVKAQVLLAHAGFSPGVIDARGCANFEKAVRAFRQRTRSIRRDGSTSQPSISWTRPRTTKSCDFI